MALRGRRAAAISLMLGACVTLGVAACGDDDSDEPETTAAAEATTNAGSADVAAPDELVGTYEVTLEKSDLPDNPAPELTDGPPDWELEIANTGEGDGRTFAISNAQLGLLEEPDFEVEGETIVLTDEECATESGYDFFDNEYTWKVDGDSLTFTTVNNQCPDQVAETILTSRPWTRTR